MHAFVFYSPVMGEFKLEPCVMLWTISLSSMATTSSVWN